MSLKGVISGIPRYLNDGMGRDTYISFFNGGFSSYPYSKSYKKDYYEISSKRNHPDLHLRRPIILYNMDGNGRDYFIHQNILLEHCKLKDFPDFPHMLRNGIEYNPIRISKNFGKTKFEKDLINRIFYGKCSGIKDRLMKPKVKFNITRKSVDNKDNKFILTQAQNLKKMNNAKINTTFNKYISNINLTDNNIKKKRIKISLSFDKKRKFLNTNYINELNDKEFIDSVNTLYLFNHKKRRDKKADLPNLI